MNLQDMVPLQQAFDLEQHDAMLEDGNAQPREQVMSPRERGQQQQVNAVQDRQFAFGNLPATVVAENRRQENREYHNGGNVILEQRNILQQVIQTIPATTSVGNDSKKSKRRLTPTVQEAHRVRQEVKDMKNAMVHALQTVDAHATQQQSIQAQGQFSHECHTGLQRLTVKQGALETAMSAVSGTQTRLNAAMLARNGSRNEKGRLDVLDSSYLKILVMQCCDCQLKLKFCTKD